MRRIEHADVFSFVNTEATWDFITPLQEMVDFLKEWDEQPTILAITADVDWDSIVAVTLVVDRVTPRP